MKKRRERGRKKQEDERCGRKDRKERKTDGMKEEKPRERKEK
jgi:hypothetical protein